MKTTEAQGEIAVRIGVTARGCAALILAAGASRRLGAPKQLLRYQGESLLSRTVRLAFEAGLDPVYAILGSCFDESVREIAGTRARATYNPSWQSGMGSSLCCGVEQILGLQPVPENIAVLVCDQPLLSAAYLSRLARAHLDTRTKVTSSQYRGICGVPAIFSAQIFSELTRIQGDRGARAIIEAYANDRTVLDFPDGATDIDTPDDIARLPYFMQLP
jgi:molybdenum cofactor cytidylyltransferase